jgi:hypothetical protein
LFSARADPRAQAERRCVLLRQLPKISTQSDGVDHGLRFISRTRPPGRTPRVGVPCFGEPPHPRERDYFTDGLAVRGGPVPNVLFRPEDRHRRSGEADVFVPVPRGNEKVHDGVLGGRMQWTATDRHGTAAVGALAERLCPHVHDHRDAEHVPGAVRVVGAIARDDFVVGLRGGERSRHPDLTGFRTNENRLANLESGELTARIRSWYIKVLRDLAEGWREAVGEEMIVNEDA